MPDEPSSRAEERPLFRPIVPTTPPAPPTRREAWMEAARTGHDRARARRRDELLVSEADTSWKVATTALRTLSSLGDDPGEVVIRPDLVFTAAPDDDARRVLGLTPLGDRVVDGRLSPARAPEHRGALAHAVEARTALAPPMARMAHRSQLAARLYLTATYVATCLLGPGAAWNNPLENVYSDRRLPSWIEVVNERRNGATEQARRRLAKALGRLHELRMVAPSRPDSDGRGRWNRWRLTEESGTGRPYQVPTDGIRLPVGFFLEGWPLVLTARELSCYLMFVHGGRRFEHRLGGTGIRHDRRLGHYGITDEAYTAHNELVELGLLVRRTDTVPGRRAGKVPSAGGRPPSELDVYRFDVAPLPGDRDARQILLDRFAEPVPRMQEYTRTLD